MSFVFYISRFVFCFIDKRDLSAKTKARGYIMEENNKISVLPMVALRGKVMLPYVTTSYDIGRLKSLNAINVSLESSVYVFICGQKSGVVEDPTPQDIYDVGVICRVKQVYKSAGENIRIQVEGVSRAKILEYVLTEEYFSVKVEEIDTQADNEVEIAAYVDVIRKEYNEYVKLLPRQNRESALANLNVGDNEQMLFNLAFNIPVKESVKQTILEEQNLAKMFEILGTAIHTLAELNKIEESIAQKVKISIDKGQKEYYLREQLKAIHSELGDDEDERLALEEQVKQKGMDKDVEEKVLKELTRMGRMNPSSPDYTVIRTYIDWILELPFNKVSKDRESLIEAEKILDKDHYGLEKVKQRIIEYIAVMKLTGKISGPILCLVGPPGVGKTSIAASIARALDRKFVRMSLGGVKDEAEIRGHRKTYIGAMPGRIMFGLKEAGTSNPVFLLDEIDKVSSDMRGDPASALLEVLDPEQNKTFRDRYLEIPYDLSQVLFITTANSLDTIPAPLLDRMEIIELSGYTEEEKVEICKKYLIPKETESNGLNKDEITFKTDAIKAIIEGYTKEAGVRTLQRQIGAVCRKVARLIGEGNCNEKQIIKKSNVADYLGVRRFESDELLSESEVGVSTGLAWTAVGGTTLNIETAILKGKGNISITGQLGDVMQESAKIAIGYIRSIADKYGIKPDIFENSDIYIHVPEGATPKDGPSAGITLATSILSALIEKPVRRDIAMTGEITLRGRVLPIGGLKEKALAAYRLGIKDIIIPAANLKDIEDIPENIRKEINFHTVTTAQEVFDLAIVK